MQSTDIAQVSIQMFIALTVLYSLVVVGVIGVVIVALTRVKVGHSASLREVFRQSKFLELTTVLVIIVSATYLGWANKMTEGIAALMSGVAGYVLGGISKQTRRDDSSSPRANPENEQTTV